MELMKNEEERHKIKAKQISDEQVTNKIVKSDARSSTYGPQGPIYELKAGR
jgi:hypothetical protein